LRISPFATVNISNLIFRNIFRKKTFDKVLMLVRDIVSFRFCVCRVVDFTSRNAIVVT